MLDCEIYLFISNQISAFIFVLEKNPKQNINEQE